MSDIEKDLNQEAKSIVDSDAEDGEEIQDWSQAVKLLNSSVTLSLPKRGEKDYEPDGTNIQDLLLYRARKAMFETLSNSARGSVLSSKVKGFYVPGIHKAVISQSRGNFMHNMGMVDREGKCWLSFHEFVYLAERGTVTPYYGVNIPKIGDGKEKDLEVPLSMQDLYSLFKSQEEMDRYFVFSHLKRLGFIVNLTHETHVDSTSFYPPHQVRKSSFGVSAAFVNVLSFFNLARISMLNTFFYNTWNFLLRKYTSTSQIYQGLNKLIPSFVSPKSIDELLKEKSTSTTLSKDQHIEIAFNVWKPQTNFKKKSPGLPDFQVVVYNKNDNHQHFPTYTELQNIFRTLDYKFEFLSENEDDFSWDDHCYTSEILRSDYLCNLKSKAVQTKSSIHGKITDSKKKKRPPKSLPAHARQSRRLKCGYRNFLLAIMDDGLISFVKISEADFGSENVWYVPSTNKMTPKNNRKKRQHTVREQVK